MSQIIEDKEHQRDQWKSAILTLLFSLLVFLLIFFYQFTKEILPNKEITTMLINFGDSQNGASEYEPQEQEGSAAVNEMQTPEESHIASEVKVSTSEKMLTGKNDKISIPVSEVKDKTRKTTAPVNKKTPDIAAKPVVKSTNSNGDGKGTAALGNLIRGRGNNTQSQGESKNTGNLGDPLGGQANGDSKIGVDRKLVAFIPGTMGRGGVQPNHQCQASGNITIAYIVDHAGNVTSAKRVSGISDPCAVSTTISWVKQYVKAEKANTSSSGTYRISF